jgi:methanogenic corrinoid protein MtbC1
MLTQIAEKVKPLLATPGAQQSASDKPAVLLGTVAGDLHDIGKNIVTFMLEVNGYNVAEGINGKKPVVGRRRLVLCSDRRTRPD